MTAPPLELSTTELIRLARRNSQVGFLTELDVRWVSADHEWELLEDLIWIGSKGDVIIVPKGFRTDFASTPRWLYPIFPPTGAWTKAAVVHDFLCRGLNDFHEAVEAWQFSMGTWHLNYERLGWTVQTAGPLPVFPERPAFNAVDTDAIFKLIMLEEGTSEPKAQLGWVGVRFGAAANPARREGWWSTFWPMFWSVSFYVAVLAMVVGVALWV